MRIQLHVKRISWAKSAEHTYLLLLSAIYAPTPLVRNGRLEAYLASALAYIWIIFVAADDGDESAGVLGRGEELSEASESKNAIGCVRFRLALSVAHTILVANNLFLTLPFLRVPFVRLPRCVYVLVCIQC